MHSQFNWKNINIKFEHFYIFNKFYCIFNKKQRIEKSFYLSFCHGIRISIMISLWTIIQYIMNY